MNKEEMNKYAYECMVKNNPEEAVKQLLLKDKTIERLNNIIDKAIKFVETLKDEIYDNEEYIIDDKDEIYDNEEYIIDDIELNAMLDILRGEDNESN